MIIYIDNEFKCHTSDNGTMVVVETDFFDNKCKEFIEGYMFVPEGYVWTRDDGEVFEGEMICPWVNSEILDVAQSTADRVQEQADKEISTLLDTIEELIIGG